MFITVPSYYTQHFHVRQPFSSLEKNDPALDVCVPRSLGGLSRQPNSVAHKPGQS